MNGVGAARDGHTDTKTKRKTVITSIVGSSACVRHSRPAPSKNGTANETTDISMCKFTRLSSHKRAAGTLSTPHSYTQAGGESRTRSKGPDAVGGEPRL